MRRHCLFFVAIVLALGGMGWARWSTQAQPSIQKGMSYAAWWSGLYSQPDSDWALAHLAETGAAWMSLIVTSYQDDISSTAIYTTTATPTDADLVHAIAQAH
ncbi:MAG: hypothetical protein FJ026_10385, partial [Chloroflexi bacterium]|nr:hypothetical protein [Chloroflexota bacterium]